MKLVKLSILFVAIATAVTAHAGDNYLEVGTVTSSISESAGKIESNSVSLTLGKVFSKSNYRSTSVEGIVVLPNSLDVTPVGQRTFTNVPGTGYSMYGAAVRHTENVTDNLRLYGRIGAAVHKLDASVVTERYTRLLVGVGAEYALGKTAAIGLGVDRLASDAHSANLHLRFNF